MDNLVHALLGKTTPYFTFDITDKIDRSQTQNEDKITTKILKEYKRNPTDYKVTKNGIDRLSELFIRWLNDTFKLEIENSGYFRDIFQTFEKEAKTTNKEPVFLIRIPLNKKKSREMIIFKKGKQDMKGIIYESSKYSEDSKQFDFLSKDSIQIFKSLYIVFKNFSINITGGQYLGITFMNEFKKIILNYLTCQSEIEDPTSSGTTINPKEVYDNFMKKMNVDLHLKPWTSASSQDEALFYFVLEQTKNTFQPFIIQQWKLLKNLIGQLYDLKCVQLQEGGGKRRYLKRKRGGGPEELDTFFKDLKTELDRIVDDGIVSTASTAVSVSPLTSDIVKELVQLTNEIQDVRLKADYRVLIQDTSVKVDPPKPTGIRTAPTPPNVHFTVTTRFTPAVAVDFSKLTVVSTTCLGKGNYTTYMSLDDLKILNLLKDASVATNPKEIVEDVYCRVHNTLTDITTKTVSLDELFNKFQLQSTSIDVITKLKNLKVELEKYLSLLGNSHEMDVSLNKIFQNYGELYLIYQFLFNHFLISDNRKSYNNNIIQQLPQFLEILQIIYQVLFIYRNTLHLLNNTLDIVNKEIFTNKNYDGPSIIPIGYDCKGVNIATPNPLTIQLTNGYQLLNASKPVEQNICSVKAQLDTYLTLLSGKTLDAYKTIQYTDSGDENTQTIYQGLLNLTLYSQEFLHFIGNQEKMQRILGQIYDILSSFSVYFIFDDYLKKKLNHMEVLITIYPILQVFSNIYTVYKNTYDGLFSISSRIHIQPIPGPSLLTIDPKCAIPTPNPVLGIIDPTKTPSLVDASKTAPETTNICNVYHAITGIDTSKYDIHLDSKNVKDSIDILKLESIFFMLMVRTVQGTFTKNMDLLLNMIIVGLNELYNLMTVDNINKFIGNDLSKNDIIIDIYKKLQIISNIVLIYQKTFTDVTGSGSGIQNLLSPPVGLWNGVDIKKLPTASGPNPYLSYINPGGGKYPSLFDATPKAKDQDISYLLDAVKTVSGLNIDSLEEPIITQIQLFNLYTQLFLDSIGQGDVYKESMNRWITDMYGILTKLTESLTPDAVARYTPEQLEQVPNLLQIVQVYGNFCRIFDATNETLNTTSYTPVIGNFNTKLLSPTLITLKYDAENHTRYDGGSRIINQHNPYETPDYGLKEAILQINEASLIAEQCNTVAQNTLVANQVPRQEAVRDLDVRLALEEARLAGAEAVGIIAGMQPNKSESEADFIARCVAMANVASQIANSAVGSITATPGIGPVAVRDPSTDKYTAIGSVVNSVLRASQAVVVAVTGAADKIKAEKDIVTAVKAYITTLFTTTDDEPFYKMANAMVRVIKSISIAVEKNIDPPARVRTLNQIAEDARTEAVIGATRCAFTYLESVVIHAGASAIELVVGDQAHNATPDNNSIQDVLRALGNAIYAAAKGADGTHGPAIAPLAPFNAGTTTVADCAVQLKNDFLATITAVRTAYGAGHDNVTAQAVVAAVVGVDATTGRGEQAIKTQLKSYFVNAVQAMAVIGQIASPLNTPNYGGVANENGGTNLDINVLDAQQINVNSGGAARTMKGPAGGDLIIFEHPVVPAIEADGATILEAVIAAVELSDNSIFAQIADKAQFKNLINVAQKSIEDYRSVIIFSYRQIVYNTTNELESAVEAARDPVIQGIDALFHLMQCAYGLFKMGQLNNGELYTEPGIQVQTQIQGLIDAVKTTLYNQVNLGAFAGVVGPGQVNFDNNDRPKLIYDVFDIARLIINGLPDGLKRAASTAVNAIKDNTFPTDDVIVAGVQALFDALGEYINTTQAGFKPAGINIENTKVNQIENFSGTLISIMAGVLTSTTAIQTYYNDRTARINAINPYLLNQDTKVEADLQLVENTPPTQKDANLSNYYYLFEYIQQLYTRGIPGLKTILTIDLPLQFLILKTLSELFIQTINSTDKNKNYMEAIVKEMTKVFTEIKKTLVKCTDKNSPDCNPQLYLVDLAHRYYENIQLIFAHTVNTIQAGKIAQLPNNIKTKQFGPYPIKNPAPNCAVAQVITEEEESLYDGDFEIKDQLYCNVQETLKDTLNGFMDLFIPGDGGMYYMRTIEINGHDGTNRLPPIIMKKQLEKLRDESEFFLQLLLNPNLLQMILEQYNKINDFSTLISYYMIEDTTFIYQSEVNLSFNKQLEFVKNILTTIFLKTLCSIENYLGECE